MLLCVNRVFMNDKYTKNPDICQVKTAIDHRNN